MNVADARHYKVVLDTSVIVSAFRSRRGASFAILSLLLDERFEIQISVPLAVEYESALSRAVGRASRSDYLVTHNVADFAGAETLGVTVITPATFLRILGERS